MEIGCEIIAVAYDDVEGLKMVLEDNKISTVISTMLLVGNKSNLEYTFLYVGNFLDYRSCPSVSTNQDPSYIVVDIKTNVAAIPSKGHTLVIFINTTNIADFVAASLDLPKWEKESYVIGDKVTWNEFEDVKGSISHSKN